MKRFVAICESEHGTKVERLGQEAKLVCVSEQVENAIEQTEISGPNLATINVHALVWALDKGWKRIINEEE